MAAPRNQESGLTDKEEAFVLHYVGGADGVRGNATQAAIAAGYSAKTARAVACEAMKRPRVKKAIQDSQAKIAAKLNLNAEQVLGNIMRLATKAERAKRFRDAMYGNELLGKHLKLFTEKHEHGGIGGGPVVFQISDSEANH
mgnify:FL=1